MKTCKIYKGAIIVNGSFVFEMLGGDFSTFAKGAYKHLGIDYPKFFKMDALSKLAFLGVEYLLEGFSSEEKEGLALVFANHSASLDTDLRHQETIQDPNNYYPSPAIFVYTLPNICLGEIAIRHGLRTESSFFIFDQYPSEFFSQYSQYLFQAGKAKKVLCAWVELMAEDYCLTINIME